MATRKRFRPHPQKQALRFEGHLIGCTDTVFAMGLEAATCGAIRVGEAEIRARSDEAHPDPDSPGLNLGQLVKVARSYRVAFRDASGAGWSTLEAELDGNAPAVLQLDYSAIGGNKIGHAIYGFRILRGNVEGVDPMVGRWGHWPVEDVKHGMALFARSSGLDAGLRFGVFRRAPWLSSDQRPQGPE